MRIRYQVSLYISTILAASRYICNRRHNGKVRRQRLFVSDALLTGLMVCALAEREERPR